MGEAIGKSNGRKLAEVVDAEQGRAIRSRGIAGQMWRVSSDSVLGLDLWGLFWTVWLGQGPLCRSDSDLTPSVIRRLVLSNQLTRDRTCSRNNRWRSRTCTSDTFPVDMQPKAATCSSGQWSGPLSPRLAAYVGRPLLRLCLNEGPEHPLGLLEVQVGLVLLHI